MWIACFDIGIVNFSLYIEEFDPTQLHSLSAIKKKHEKDGTPTSEFQSTLNSLYRTGKSILFEVVELTSEKVNPYAISNQVISALTTYLKNNKEVWDMCSCFIIEKQMFLKNSNAERLSQHCFSFFDILYGNHKCITFIGASRKTRLLGCPLQFNEKKKKYEALPKPKRKKWSIDNALQVFYLRRDYSSILDMVKYHKQDDIADCVNLLQAFKYLVFVEKKFNSN